jgi:hypothetical protein
MADKIRCSQCRFVRVDGKASEKGWTAYECGNSKSEYHKSLLNVTPNGERQAHITWAGCVHGQKGERGGFRHDR